MRNSDIVNYIDAHIYSAPLALISGDMVNTALHNMASMDWRVSGTLTDGDDSPNNGVLSMDVINRVCYDAAGIISLGYDTRSVYDEDGNISLRYGNTRDMLDGGFQNSISWGLRRMYDAAGAHKCMDYGLRELFNTDGTVVTTNWGLYVQYDASGIPSHYWNLRQNLASDGSVNIDYSAPGAPTAPTQASSDNSNRIATTAFCKSQGGYVMVTDDANGVTSSYSSNYFPGTGISAYMILVVLTVTAVSGGSVSVALAWNDENDTAQTATLLASATTVGAALIVPVVIKNHHITSGVNIQLVFNKVGTITYDRSVRILKM